MQIHPISPQYNSIQSNLEITSDRILLALVIDEFHKLGGFLLSSAIPFDGISLYCGGQIYWSCVVQIHLKWESQNTILAKISSVSIHCLFQLRILGMTSSGQTDWFPLIWSHVAPSTIPRQNSHTCSQGINCPLSDFPAYEEMMLDLMCEIADPDDKSRLIVECLQ